MVKIIDVTDGDARQRLSGLKGFRIYAIDFGAAGVKIGFTGNIKNRLSSLELEMRRFGVPHKASNVAVTKIHHWVQIGEKELHQKFAGSRTTGEFFDVSFSEVVDAMSGINVTDDPDPHRGARADTAFKFLSGMVSGDKSSTPKETPWAEFASPQELCDALVARIRANPELFACSMTTAILASEEGERIMRHAIRMADWSEAEMLKNRDKYPDFRSTRTH